MGLAFSSSVWSVCEQSSSQSRSCKKTKKLLSLIPCCMHGRGPLHTELQAAQGAWLGHWKTPASLAQRWWLTLLLRFLNCSGPGVGQIPSGSTCCVPSIYLLPQVNIDVSLPDEMYWRREISLLKIILSNNLNRNSVTPFNKCTSRCWNEPLPHFDPVVISKLPTSIFLNILPVLMCTLGLYQSIQHSCSQAQHIHECSFRNVRNVKEISTWKARVQRPGVQHNHGQFGKLVSKT